MAIGLPLKYIYIYIYLYIAGPITTFMNAAITLTYSRAFKTRLKPLINVAIYLTYSHIFFVNATKKKCGYRPACFVVK